MTAWCRDLSTERQRYSISIRQSHKLFSQVKQLGQELDLVQQEKQQVSSNKINTEYPWQTPLVKYNLWDQQVSLLNVFVSLHGVSGGRK